MMLVVPGLRDCQWLGTVDLACHWCGLQPRRVLLLAWVKDICKDEPDARELDDAKEAERIVGVAGLGDGVRCDREANMVLPLAASII